MLWPPIPYSYDTIVKGDGRSALLPPSCAHLLGTDDQARDVMARLIYGFRISVLFGLVAHDPELDRSASPPAPMQGYFGGWIDLAFQRFLEIWSSMPTLYLLIILASFIQPGFWSLLGIMLLFSWMALVGLVRAEFLRGRNFDYVRAARALGMLDVRIMFRHILPNAMTASLTFLPFILAGSVTDPDLARLPGLRPAAGLAVARRAAAAGQEQPQRAVARLHRLRHHRAHAVAAGVHRRGGARRLQSAQGAGMSEPALLEVRDLSVDVRHRRRCRARGAAASASTSGAARPWRWSARSGSGKSVTALSVLQLLPYPTAQPSHRQHPLPGPRAGRRAGARAAGRARQPRRR